LSVPVKLLSTLAVQGVLPELVARYQAATGNTVEVHFAPTNSLLEFIASGETADVAIITRAALDDLVRKGAMRADSVTDIAISHVGIAVKTGAAKPDISSVAALVASLLSANSIAYSSIGASGVFFAGLLRRLGIADTVSAKAVITAGLTGEVVARGEAELGVQQISELMQVPGLDIAGPLPPGAESITMFSAGVFSGSMQADAARNLISALRSPDAGKALEAAGLQRPV
jgi:molybdate transport system substrate-binding protein